MSARCTSPLDLAVLAAYALGELSEPEEARVEEHYFSCAECTARLEWLRALSRGVVALVCEGRVNAAVRGGWVQRATGQGLRVRQYAIAPGGSVNCTVAADDDFVVVRLGVDRPLTGELRLETDFHDLERDHHERRDLAAQFVDPDTGELAYAFSGELVRTFPRSRWVMHLCAPGGERLGPYVMNHTPGA